MCFYYVAKQSIETIILMLFCGAFKGIRHWPRAYLPLLYFPKVGPGYKWGPWILLESDHREINAGALIYWCQSM